MRVLKMVLTASVVMGAAACGGPKEQVAKADDLMWLDSLVAGQALAQPAAAASPVELGMTAEAGEVDVKSSVADLKPQVEEQKPTVTRRTASSARPSRRSTARASSGSYSGGSSSGAVYRQPRVVTKKNTGRDAAIGAGAGAVIGAVAGGSRHRVRNAVVGAVLGGAAGAVIGSTVDVQRRVEY